MRKTITILLCAFLFACSMNLTSDKEQANVEKIEGAIRVAILPIEKLDSQSGYIKKIIEVRDLEMVFGQSAKFELIDLEQTKEAFLDLGDDISVEELEKDEITDLGKELNADIVITATVEEIRNPRFSFVFTMFSLRTGEVRPGKVVLVKYKEPRLDALENKFVKKINDFVNYEMKKLTEIAILNYNIKKYDIAEASFLNIKKINPKLNDPYYYLGLINFKNEKLDEALTYFNYLVEQDTTSNINYLEKQAHVYRSQRKFRQAAGPMTAIAEIEQTKDRWLDVADIYGRANDINNMEAAILEAVAIAPEDEAVISRYATILYDKQQFEEAIPYLEKSALAFPDDEMIANNLVSAYQQTGQIDQAIANYKKIIKKDKNDINARLNLANMYLAAAKDATKAKKTRTATKLKKSARKEFDAVIKIDKTNGIVYTRLASLYLEEKNYAKAESNASKAKLFSPANYAPLLLIAQINQTLGIDEFKKAAKFNAEIPKASGSKAETLANKRDTAKESAASLYKIAEDNLNDAMKYTEKANVINVIEKRLASLRELNERLETSF